MKYRKKSEHVEAIEFHSFNPDEEMNFSRCFSDNPEWLVEGFITGKIMVGSKDSDGHLTFNIYRKDGNGPEQLKRGQFLVFSDTGNYFPMDKPTFRRLYEKVRFEGDFESNIKRKSES